MINLFNYIDRPSPIHRLTGAAKLICVLMWTLAAMVTYDTRILIALPVLGFILFGISKIRLSDIKVMLIATLIFMLLNNLFVFLLSPTYGCEIYGSRTELFTIAGPYVITAEQLFYHLNLLLKYLCQVPMIILFVSTTEPSEFAASLNRIGVNYKIAYSVSLALRYIPDIQREYVDISLAQQARGIEMSRRESLSRRLKAAGAILVPLILSSMDRIETISNAMELRGFGKGKRRSWYRAKPFTAGDIIAICSGILLFVFTVYHTVKTGTRFYNPFH